MALYPRPQTAGAKLDGSAAVVMSRLEPVARCASIQPLNFYGLGAHAASPLGTWLADFFHRSTNVRTEA
jgi:hypothetical protein